MKKHEKYLETLKTFTDYITIAEWANKFAEIYPDGIKESEENKKVIIRKIVKNITSLIFTGKWSNILLIDKSTKPQKVKYITNEQREANINKDIHLSISIKDVKSTNFKHLMKELENIPDDYDLPHRDDPKYCGDDEIKGIEQIDIYEFNTCMVFEMATRNKDVIEIINKLNYIEELQNKYPYLEHEDCLLFKPIEPDFDAELQLPVLTEELKKEYEAIAKMSISKFHEELDFLIDTEYSDNYNENWYENMINDGLDDPYKITDELYKKYKHKTSVGKITIDNKYLTCGKLNIIFEYLQNKLKNEYFIFPEGYYKGLEKKCHEEVVDKDFIDATIFNDKEIRGSINNAIKEFRALKPTYMEQIADIFFMYDYYTKRKADENLTFYAQDIKSELTKYHGIEIQNLKEKLTYDDCLDSYEEFKDLEASFYTVEKSITSKIKLLENFIDNRLYRFILFH